MASETLSFITLDAKGRATLPDSVRKEMGVAEGGLLLLERTDHGTFELVPASLVPNDQLWFHHAEMQARIAEAETDFAEGRSGRAEDIEGVRTHLDALKAPPAKAAGATRARRRSGS